MTDKGYYINLVKCTKADHMLSKVKISSKVNDGQREGGQGQWAKWGVAVGTCVVVSKIQIQK